MTCQDDKRITKLQDLIFVLYQEIGTSVPFHGWHHIDFVRNKAVEFARQRGADSALVEAAALVHDLNYIAEKDSGPQAGHQLRRQCLQDAGFNELDIHEVEKLVVESHTATRTASISLAGTALSDADTLFKALPITPVVFAPRYLEENNIDLLTLCEKIIGEQEPLLKAGIYFYDERVRDRYLPWAEANLQLWRCVAEALNDPDVTTLLKQINDALHRP
ncbi:hypothetical protein [Spirillospora sp. NPDC047279]|uniref:hypothetical protein n=1 Tax=Spirillospora sp. NPDC047279 TaxID=3155478 RepID=UPI0033E6C445